MKKILKEAEIEEEVVEEEEVEEGTLKEIIMTHLIITTKIQMKIQKFQIMHMKNYLLEEFHMILQKMTLERHFRNMEKLPKLKY